jgi:ABC-2 type transport system permease protein
MPIYRRELRAYFQNPSIYVMLAVFLAFMGIYLYGEVKWFSQMSLRGMQFQSEPLNFTETVVKSMFWAISFLLMFIVPLMTMRLFAEEKRSGTFELLSSLPLSDAGLVLGKFLAAGTVLVLMLATTVVFPIALDRWVKGVVEWPIVAAGYLAIILLGLAYTAFGTFASSLTENQIIAAGVTFFSLFLLFLFGGLASIFSGTVATILETISLLKHSENLIRGRIFTEDLYFFLAFTLGFLFLANYVLESRRWRA